MENTKQRKFVSLKLDILKEQKNSLVIALESLDEVLRLGSAWVDGTDEGKTLIFGEINTLIDDTSLQLTLLPSQMKVGLGTESTISGHMTPQDVAMISKASEQQLNTEECLKDASALYLQVKQDQNSALLSVNKQRRKNKKKQKETETNLNKRVIDLEEKVQDLIKIQTEREKDLQKELRKRQEDANREVENHFHKLSSVVENLKKHFCELEGQFNHLQIRHVTDTLFADLKKDVPGIDFNTAFNFNSKTKDAPLFNDLERRTTSNADVLMHILTQQKKDFEKLQVLEAKVNEIQWSIGEAFGNFEQKCEGIEFKFQTMCTTIDKLETLTDPSNMSSNVNAEYTMKLQEVEDKMESLMSTLSHIDDSHGNRWIGFAAKLSGDWCALKRKMEFVEKGKMIKFTNVIFDCGGNFDPVDGKFIAPRDGVYVTCLTMHQYNDGQVGLHIIKKPCSSASSVKTHKSVILETYTDDNLDRDCQFSILEMGSGDQLYVKVVTVSDNPLLTDNTVFSCFLLS